MHDDHNIFNVDLNGDGIADLSLVASDADALGIPHELRIDAHLHGELAPEISFMVSDTDGDMLPELASLRLDLDGDGSAGLTLHAIDVTGDMVPDWVVPDVAAAELWDEASPLIAEISLAAEKFAEDALDWVHREFTDFSVPTLVGHDQVHGTPLEDMQLWDGQDSAFSCAVATSNMLFRSVGLEIGEPFLADVFQESGIYDPALGTDVARLDDVLNQIAETLGGDHFAAEIHGFELEGMKTLLDEGVRPLIALDSCQLADPFTAKLNDLGLIPDSGHAVQLTGIIENEGEVFAVINDPGIPGGMGMEIPWGKFMHASEEYGFQAVALF